MKKKLNRFVEKTFRLPVNEGENKVIDLKQAIAAHIQPGMQLFLGENANAAICELIRQHWGKDPGFTFITAGTRDYSSDIVHCRLGRKMIFSSCAESFPYQGPCRTLQRAFKDKSCQFEHWSLYTIALRLMAGGLGTGFMPTFSLTDSDLARDNPDAFLEIEDPFGSGRKVGLVRAVNPDICLIHGMVADQYGNIILSPQVNHGDQPRWASLASRQGVVATVEKIVSTGFIREHSQLVGIPGYLVKSVSVAPLGLHPQGMANLMVPGVSGYSADLDFITEHREATRTPEKLDAWLKEWVRDCPTHDDYLRKLGQERLAALRGSGQKDAPEDNFIFLRKMFSRVRGYSPVEMMLAIAARKIKEKVLAGGHRIILSGMGTSALSAWLAYYLLKNDGYLAEVMLGTGFVGLAPRPGEPQVPSLGHIPTCKMITDVVYSYGGLVAGENNRCLSVLGASQIDKYGNLNSSVVDGNFIIGSGGANDAANAREVVVVSSQSRRRLCPSVDYITCPGRNVTVLVTDRGIFEKTSPRDEFVLTALLPDDKLPGTKARIAAVRENCGWEVKVSPSLTEVSPPVEEELGLLRWLDPQGYFRASGGGKNGA